MRLYRRAAPVIRGGKSRRYGETGENWRHPRGWQAVVRAGAGGESVLAVLHAFASPPPHVRVPMASEQGWRIEAQFAAAEGTVRYDGTSLLWAPVGQFTAAVLLLTREGQQP
jgi:alpha-galactosidase